MRRERDHLAGLDLEAIERGQRDISAISKFELEGLVERRTPLERPDARNDSLEHLVLSSRHVDRHAPLLHAALEATHLAEELKHGRLVHLADHGELDLHVIDQALVLWLELCRDLVEERVRVLCPVGALVVVGGEDGLEVRALALGVEDQAVVDEAHELRGVLLPGHLLGSPWSPLRLRRLGW